MSKYEFLVEDILNEKISQDKKFFISLEKYTKMGTIDIEKVIDKFMKDVYSEQQASQQQQQEEPNNTLDFNYQESKVDSVIAKYLVEDVPSVPMRKESPFDGKGNVVNYNGFVNVVVNRVVGGVRNGTGLTAYDIGRVYFGDYAGNSRLHNKRNKDGSSKTVNSRRSINTTGETENIRVPTGEQVRNIHNAIIKVFIKDKNKSLVYMTDAKYNEILNRNPVGTAIDAFKKGMKSLVDDFKNGEQSATPNLT